MRLPIAWLDDYVRPGLEPPALAARLAMTGTEVDRIHHHGVAALERFVVGRVLSAAQHPDADRLTVCSVDVGDPAGPQQIVCGAPNVAAGQTVAVARPGAVMPDGKKLGVAKLRGVESNGMILAEDELGLGTDHAGIIELEDSGLAPGTPLVDVLPIATAVLELEITPNRPDCLGVYGVAREVHAATGAPLAPPPWAQDAGGPGSVAGAEVVVEVPELCPRFTARLFEDVTIGPSPLWLKARLMAAGQRPISNVVDITNYVMLLTGQPLHAFDLDRVAGARLVVRRAGAGETMTTLDDVERVLDPDVVLIADDEGPTSIAGVMGGARSEVHDGTTRVLLEVAAWDGANINRTMNRLGLRTEAGARFEKGLSPEQTLEAQAVATQLMIDLCGARLADGTIDVGGAVASGPPAPIRVRDARIRGLLGVGVERAQARITLEALGFETTDRDDGLEVVAPHWRARDVRREADVIEEIARLVALDDLPATLPRNRTGQAAALTASQRLRRRAADALVGAGLYEVAGWSFTDAGLADRLGLPAGDPRRAAVVLENPMSEDGSVLRTTLLGSLLDVARHNRNRGATGLRLFEQGAIYLAGAGHDEQAARHPGGDRLPLEVQALGALVEGDVFAAKAILELLARALRADIAVEQSAEPFLHPGRAGSVLAGGTRVGWLGEVHPAVAARWDLEQVSAFVLDFDGLVEHGVGTREYEDVTSFPELRQDIAVVVADDVPAARVVEVVRRAGGERLARAEVFDVYSGEQIPAGHRSLALALAFRAPDRTLTDEDVAPLRAAIVDALSSELGGELRG